MESVCYTGNKTIFKDSALNLFNPDTFDFDWEQLDDRGKMVLLEQASKLPPFQGIYPVILGVQSSDSSIRSRARAGLVQMLKNINGQLACPDEKKTYTAALKESSQVASRLYRQISFDLSESDLDYFFTALMSFGDAGAFFAFKILLKNTGDFAPLLQVIEQGPESHRLNFVDQYLQAEPDVRLHHAKMFKGILKSIGDRSSVITYYARLFDQKRDVDPFLTHIDPDLRDAGAIMENEIPCASAEMMITGLKALAMVEGDVPSQVLIHALDNQENLEIRRVVYTVIENGSKGQYPKLFEPVWQHFCRACRSDKREAMFCFRALVVMGSFSLSDLMDRVKKQCPGILPEVHNEIARLSRISFFFIQDLALNREKYLTDHFDINQACMLGMIRKRPERVVKILSRIPKGGDSETTAIIKKIRTLLVKEADGIKSQFGMKTSSAGKPRYSILTDSEKKILKTLGDRPGGSFLNFQSRIIQDVDLADQTLSGPVLYFNQAVIKGGNWSGLSVSNAYFKSSIFLDLDLSNARFEGVCFDNSLFRNVKAKGAVFRDCSFQGARLFNCDFSHGDFTDALFTGACIAKTQFTKTNLAYASFSHCEISAVSFATAALAHADFSFVRAKFVRFPAYDQIRTLRIDYNAVKYPLDLTVLPEFPARITAEINLLVFCEFIRYGQGKFLEQNKLSLLTAFDIFKPRRADLFQIVPLLIHENIELIGSNPIDAQTPCGIADFYPSHQALAILETYSKNKELKGKLNLTPSIEALYTMGSIGSLAQTPESDIDYWVCIDGKIVSGELRNLLEQKLGMLETLAQELFETSVTFFIVDIQKARDNDFGGSSQESSGSAQAWLLKEEFYRTMIHVAGKLPLWSVLPTSISLKYYNLILTRASKYTSSQRYIDLGDIHYVPVNEYFGAAIWQMFKWLKSPFKSVIKMALFEIYAKIHGKPLLLCNQYKNEWMNSGTRLKFTRNDSYLAILNKLLPYYQSVEDTESMDIILTCFFLKLEIQEKNEIEDTPFGIRKILFKRVLSDWGWSDKKALDLGQYRHWSYSDIRDLSASIETYMFSKFEQVQKAFDHPDQSSQMISDSDRERLTRKVDIVYKKKFYKINKLFLIAVNETYFSNLHMKYYHEGVLSGKWELFHKNEEISMDHEEPLFRADRIEQIAAWLIFNHLFTADARMGLVPNPTSIGHNDIQNLYRAMSNFFAAELDPATQFYDATQSLPIVVSMFITINMNSDQPRSFVEDYCAVYLNSWGEMFCLPSSPGKRFDTLALAKKQILSSMGVQSFPVNTKVYFPRGRVG